MVKVKFPFTLFQGISDVKGELKKDYSSFKINTLCRREDSGVISVVCFTTAAPLLSFAWKFYVMTNTIKSDIFYSVWSSVMKQARDHPDININDLELKIWTPALASCQKILNGLHGLSMTLAEVDQHFKNYSEDKIEEELHLLCSGVHRCMTQHPPLGDEWIHECVCRIADYRKLCKYRDTANYFLELKTSLKLTQGDFRDVERISQQVNFHNVYLMYVFVHMNIHV